ncbi:MAG TPA: translation initiation factor IF-2 [bacterium]|nr:translation initiation factor IF-2 [bacterium]
MSKKKRIYQAAKEFNISTEALIDFLHNHKISVRNHMVPVTEDMYSLISEHFIKKEEETDRTPDFRKKIQEKKQEEEARREAIRHEIDEVLEASKGDVFERVKIVTKPKVAVKKAEKKEKPVEEAVREDQTEKVKEEIKETAKKEQRRAVTEKTREKEISGKKAPEQAEKTKEKEVEEKPRRQLKRHPKIKPVVALEEDKAEAEKSKKRKKGRARPEQTLEDAMKEGGVPGKKKKRRRRKKTAVQIDEKEIEASIRETLARMSGDTAKKRRRRKEKEIEDVVQEEHHLLKATEFTSVAELANIMGVEASDVIQTCISLGLMVTINQRLDKDTILMVADEFGYDVRFLTEYGEERLDELIEEEDDAALMEYRSPVVTVMGHVDHGKTSLLDYIRKSNIIAGESGGITQHIGAYVVDLGDKKITFLDTPGHQAFTAMRARGAQVTDIVVLIVAADDSVMPQTIEAINHARAAAVPIIVAINKIDKPGSEPEKIRKNLSEHNVLVEQWGGKVQCAEISAKTGEGVDRLLEMILLEAEVLELKANPHGHARAVIIEARMDKGRGAVGTLLVQKGIMTVGDVFVAGQNHGKVRAMFDERDRSIKKATPSTPVQVLGFTGMPQAGDVLVVVDSEQEAKEISLKRQQLKREQGFRQFRRITLDQISRQIAEGEVKELSVIVKADVDGSLEALIDSLMALSTEDVTVRIIHKSVGAITETDVLLAEASNAVIIGFHVSPNPQAKELARRESIDIRLYKVIYDAVNDVKLALSGLLEPEISEEVIGVAEIREVFKASRIGQIAGCSVQSGKAVRNAHARLIRDGKVIHEGKIISLKRFKEDAREVTSGYECGITLDTGSDIQPGDLIEVYQFVETARTL